MKIIFIAALIICFISYMLRTIIQMLEYKKSKDFYPIIRNIMFIAWFSWFTMCFSDPVKIEIPMSIRLIGLALFIAGIILFIVSYRRLGGLKAGKHLITSGIYSKIRHPMYLGFILWIIGFPLFLQSLIALTSGVMWITHIIYWKVIEEKDLENKFTGYKDYKKRTWF